MRMTQYRGFTPQAMQWLNKNVKTTEYTEITTRIYHPSGRSEKMPRRQIIEVNFRETDNIIMGMLEEEVRRIREYDLANGQGIIEEFVQAQPWSSGPCIFMALRFKDSKKPVMQSLWSNKDIDEA